MNRTELLEAIARSLADDAGVAEREAEDYAHFAIATIEALGFVVVPREPTSDMYLRAGFGFGEAMKHNPMFRLGDYFKLQWDSAIAASPLYWQALPQPAGKDTRSDGDV